MRLIFARYLALGSVNRLLGELDAQGIRTKINTTAGGRSRGGVRFSRGSLFHLLKNRVYLGEITHKRDSHPGLHDAIIEPSLFESVQRQLAAKARRSTIPSEGRAASPLAGRIFDAAGRPMSPTFARGRGGRIYRYYVSAPMQRAGVEAGAIADPAVSLRVPAGIVEGALIEALARRSGANSPDDVRQLEAIIRVEVHPNHLVVVLDPDVALIAGGVARIVLPFALATHAGRTRILLGDGSGPRRDPVLIRALRAAHAMLDRDAAGQPILDAAPLGPHRNRIIALAFMAPDLQQAILDGRQPRGISLAMLLAGGMPLLWSEQRARLGDLA